MQITVIGCGYVGLVTAACFAEMGNRVACVDADEERIAALQRGVSPIYEPGIEGLLQTNQRAGRLTFHPQLSPGLSHSDVVFIAVGTPPALDGSADISQILGVAAQLGALLDSPSIVVCKSTAPVGTACRVQAILDQLCQRRGVGWQHRVVSNPEFLKEGAAIDDFMRPDRIVVGVESDRAAQVMADIYRPLYLRDFPILTTDLESAEMIKYAANAFLATKITFINEIAALCERTGADVKLVSQGMGLDGRIGNKFLHAGPGYGGSCFPKDTKALARIGQEYGLPMQITETVIKVNEETRRRMVDKVADMLDGKIAGKTIAVLGVTFKPNTDDMREAPSLTVIPALIGGGAKVRAVDPQGHREASEMLPGVTWLDDAYEAAQDADALVILTEWNEFRALDLKRLAEGMSFAALADLRNIYSSRDAKRAGFKRYVSVGRTDFVDETPAAVRQPVAATPAE